MAIIWKDRKRPFLGLPLSFTKYELTEQKLMIHTGIFSIKEEEIRLYRFVDITLRQSLIQRLLGVGDLQCMTTDRSSGDFVIKLIKNPKQVKELLSDAIEQERERKRVSVREFMTDSDEEDIESDME